MTAQQKASSKAESNTSKGFVSKERRKTPRNPQITKSFVSSDVEAVRFKIPYNRVLKPWQWSYAAIFDDANPVEVTLPSNLVCCIFFAAGEAVFVGREKVINFGAAGDVVSYDVLGLPGGIIGGLSDVYFVNGVRTLVLSSPLAGTKIVNIIGWYSAP